MDKLGVAATAEVEAEARVQELVILVILYKEEQGDLAVAEVEAEPINRGRRLQMEAILSAVGAAVGAGPPMAPRLWVDWIQEISVEDLEGLAPQALTLALGAEAEVEEAVSEARSLLIAI